VSTREPAPQARDGWEPHVLVALFCALVAAILVLVPGWSAPLHAWIALAAFVLVVLAAHAMGRTIASAWRRRWRAMFAGGLLAAGLIATALALLLFGHRYQPAVDDPFADARAIAHRETR